MVITTGIKSILKLTITITLIINHHPSVISSLITKPMLLGRRYSKLLSTQQRGTSKKRENLTKLIICLQKTRTSIFIFSSNEHGKQLLEICYRHIDLLSNAGLTKSRTVGSMLF